MEPKDHHTIHPEFPTKAFKAHKVYYLNEPSEENTYADIEAVYQCLETEYGISQEDIILLK